MSEIALDPALERSVSPLDVWLKGDLRRRYDGVAAEPLPDSLSGLIDSLFDR